MLLNQALADPQTPPDGGAPPLRGSFHAMKHRIVHKLGASEELFDFLTQCLILDPNERISVEDALNHPFFGK